MAMEIKPGLPDITRDISGPSKGVRQTDGTSLKREGDSVTLTREAGSLLSTEGSLASSKGIDEVRVSEIRQSLDDGTFQAEPEKIATKLIEQELDLLL